ncbi:hypothetical protein EDD22DRAFT_1031148 [Suillus occidentalis]|nr:hypothetical protein EDD22DRAFT_1031148 [Suillus occidentalis]
MDDPKPSRRPRDRDPAQPADFAERIVAFQRRNAASSHPRERPERTPSSRLQLSNPNPPLSRSNISTRDSSCTSCCCIPPRGKFITAPQDIYTPPPSHLTHQGKLNTDPIPMRCTTEPELISDATNK